MNPVSRPKRAITGPATVVHAHPSTESFTEAVLGEVVAGLTAAGRSATTLRFWPPVETGERHVDTADSEELIVVAPTWWGAMPAVVLDWIQGELSPWIDDGASPDSSPLRRIAQLTVVTTHGSSKFVNLLQGEPGRLLWRDLVLPICGPHASFEWLALYKVDQSTDAERQAFLARVQAHFAGSRAA